MTVNELLIMVRRRLGDMQKLSLSDEELIMSLNMAIDRLSEELTADGHPEIVKEFTIEGDAGVPRPADFISLCGQFPLVFSQEVDGIKIKHMDPNYNGTMVVRYFANRPHVSKLTDEIPFERILEQRQLVTYTVYDIRSVTGEVKDDSSGTNG